MVAIEYDPTGDVFVVKCPRMDKRAAQAPEVNHMNGLWYITASPANIRHLTEQFDRRYFSAPAAARVLQEKAQAKKAEQFPGWFKFKNPPMDKQWDALNKAWDNPACALFLDMGCGKTFVSINIAAARAQNGDINGLLVICPTAVMPVWDIEFEAHCPIDYSLHEVRSGRAKATEAFIGSEADGLKVMVVGVEALSQGKAASLAERFILAHRAMIVVDESSRIKTPSAGRTKKAQLLGTGCKYKLILSGTPVTQGMQDLYSQFRFLDWSIIGQKSYFTFRNRYCIMGGFEARTIIGYYNQDELLDRIAPVTVLIKKEEMMDLPPKVYETLHVEPSPEQKKALTELGDPFVMATVMDDKELIVSTILERMTRYQQIVGGHFPFKEEGEQKIIPFTGKNPKMDALMDSIDILPDHTKVIIWARFIPEIEAIQRALGEKYGYDSVLLYYGATPQDDRKQILAEFQGHTGPRFFVSNPAMGGMGITLTAATYTYYYSNTFSLEDRLQSEDRNHRKGQNNKVTYLDVTMNHDIDRAMIRALRNKKEIADYVTEELEERTK